jgi:hypothetical protein
VVGTELDRSMEAANGEDLKATTRLAAGTPPAPRGRRAERAFYASYILGLVLLVLVGFAPTFFLRGLVDPYWPPLRPIRPVVLAHGIVTTAFVLLFPLQAWLIGRGQRAMHMRVGRWGFALGGAVALTIYLVAADQYHRAIAPAQPLTDFATVALVLALAWRWRLDAQAHKRMMIALLCVLTGAGVGRVPITDQPVLLGFSPNLLLPFVLLAPLWVWDLATRGRIHVATVVGTALLTSSLVKLLLLPSSDWEPLFAILPGSAGPS